MKKVLVVMMVLLVNMANAQEHLRFKGAQINGSFDTFVTELEKRGCKSGENIFGTFLIKADFAGLEMLVYPLTTSQTKTVYAVVAGTDKIEEKVSLIAQYNELKNLLTQKYGEGKETTLPDGWYRNIINDIERGNACSSLLFENDKGRIYLYIHEENFKSSINVQYIDKINEQLKIKESQMDI